MKTKICPYCEIEKPVSDFTKNLLTKDGLKYECRACSSSRKSEYYLKNKTSEKIKDKIRREKYKIEHNGKGRIAVLRQEVLDGYGRVCKCCGETNEQFLALDHVNGGGRKHIIEKGAQAHYHDARKRNFPTDYRVLCHNCNFSLGHYGFCPHQVERGEYDGVIRVSLSNV